MNALSPSHLRERKKESRERCCTTQITIATINPPLVISNKYGSNLNILELGLDGFHQFYKDNSLDLAAVLAQRPSVRKWILIGNINKASVFTSLRN
jgi:hypothetical protein